MYDTFKVHFYLWLNYPKTAALIFHVISIVFCIEQDTKLHCLQIAPNSPVLV